MANIYDTTANLTMRRSVMDVILKQKMSIPFGKLVPIGAPVPVLPKDTFKTDFAGIIRMLTPKAPIMDDISGDIYSFFVPWRIIWSQTKQFFGENDLVAWTLPQDVLIPHVQLKCTLPSVGTSRNPTTTPSCYIPVGSPITKYFFATMQGTLLDYFNLPFVYIAPNQKTAIESDLDTNSKMVFDINALPFRGYQLIWNEFFRKSAIVDPKLDFAYDGLDKVVDVAYSSASALSEFNLCKVARWNDLYSSCLPSPQRGESVQMPLLGDAPLYAKGNAYSVTDQADFVLKFGSATTTDSKKILGLDTSSDGKYGVFRAYTATAGEDAVTLSNGPYVTGVNLYADLSKVTAASINDLRIAVATQRYYEALAHANRYTDYISVMFGGHPSDAVLQRPQYLGGCHFDINMAQVLSTTETASMPVGSTGAVSVTGIKENLYHNSFDEFGYVFHFVVLRKEHSYCQGLDKDWTKSDIWDIYNPKFAHIGEVPVERNSVWFAGHSDSNVLGYNEPWFEYRSIPSKSAGLLNPLHPNSLSYFTLTDVLPDAPSLNEAFVSEDANGLDNALVASASVTDQFIADFRIKMRMTRVMPTHPVPGLMDHF